MRGSRAKALRASVLRQLPANASPVAAYEAAPGTAREKYAMRPCINLDGTPGVEKVIVNTVTFQLARTCVRFWTQRFKRHHVRTA